MFLASPAERRFGVSYFKRAHGGRVRGRIVCAPSVRRGGRDACDIRLEVTAIKFFRHRPPPPPAFAGSPRGNSSHLHRAIRFSPPRMRRGAREGGRGGERRLPKPSCHPQVDVQVGATNKILKQTLLIAPAFAVTNYCLPDSSVCGRGVHHIVRPWFPPSDVA
jgi:hypothetical protein